MRSPMRSPSVSPRAARCARAKSDVPFELARGVIWIVRGDDGGAVVVIARVQDKTDGVPDPLCGLDRAQFIEHQNLGVENWTKDVELSRLYRLVVGILNLLEQLAVVVKKTSSSLAENQLFNYANGKMSFADADAADD